MTVAKALHLIDGNQLSLDRRTVIVVDEAAMMGTPELRRLLEASTAAHTRTILVGDPYQLAPVNARGGMFEHLCAELPWSQRLAEAWRIRDREERGASLALRSDRGNRLRKALGWYRAHDRLHTGDPIAMAADAHDAYLADRAAGKNALLICDTWEMADALNQRLHDALTVDGPSLGASRDQQIRAGDIIISRRNDAGVQVRPTPGHDRVDQVRNGNRWRVAGIDAERARITAERLTDNARVVFEGEYLREHVSLGYAATVHSHQGVTADTCHAILSESATRAMAYVAMTRGRDHNHAYIYTRDPGEADHEHRHVPDHGEDHRLRRSTKYAAAHYFRMILANDDRPRTMHAEAQRTNRELLPTTVAALLQRNDERRTARAQAWRQHAAQTRARQSAYERFTVSRDAPEQRIERERSLGGDSLEL